MMKRLCNLAVLLVTIAAVASACKSPTSASPTPMAGRPPAQMPEPPPPTRSPAETLSTTTVSFTSDPQHSVGRGRSLTLTLQNATFEPTLSHNGGRLFMRIRQKDAPTAWGFHVMTPNFGATPIAPGAYNAAGDPLLPAWVFDFFGDARGCSGTARLVIHAIELTLDLQTLKHFRASFQDYHCNGASPGMQGEIAILADPWR